MAQATPLWINRRTAWSSASLASPPRLMLATAGLTAWAATQSTPAMTSACGAIAVTIEDTNGMERDLLGDAIDGAADGASHVGAVAVAVVCPPAIVDRGITSAVAR